MLSYEFAYPGCATVAPFRLSSHRGWKGWDGRVYSSFSVVPACLNISECSHFASSNVFGLSGFLSHSFVVFSSRRWRSGTSGFFAFRVLPMSQTALHWVAPRRWCTTAIMNNTTLVSAWKKARSSQNSNDSLRQDLTRDPLRIPEMPFAQFPLGCRYAGALRTEQTFR